ncbi:hypothetical protein D3C75_1137140 [compost metagenome]
MFGTTPLTLYSGGEWGSEASSICISSGRYMPFHTWAQPRKKRCSPVKPSSTGASLPSSDSR